MEWAAEAHVTEELAGRLVREQFPPLPERSVALLSEGWDYAVHLVDGAWAFRFPRREAVLAGLRHELAVLPGLARRLPVAVPVPVQVGRPGGSFPWPFYGARLLPGVEAGEARLGEEERCGLARPLARALRGLHTRETLAAVGDVLPFDPVGRADMTVRVPRTRAALAAVAGLGLWEPPPAADALLERAAALPPARPEAVCHGDLHVRQILVERGELSGIVDWIDVCRSDPGVDLQLVWSFLPLAGREAFLDEYGPVSPESLLRARVLALFLNAVLLRYGHVEGRRTLEAEALAALERTLA